jgi:ATP synthase protein I
LVDERKNIPYNPKALLLGQCALGSAARNKKTPLTGQIPGKSVIWTPLKIVGLQVVAGLACAGLWWTFRGGSAATSAMLGAVVCFVPGALFALRLARAGARQDGYVFAFFLGEGIKVLLSVALFGLVAAMYPDADWLALLTTFIAVLQVYVFGFLLTSR